MDNPFQSPSVLSLCSGGRGLERGLERAIGKIRVAAYVEIEAFLTFNLAAQMEQGVVAPAPVWTDVKTFPSEFFHKKIHGIIGGYPCQGESIAGNTKGHRDKRFLWWHIERHIQAIKPLWCFFENVENHLNVSFPIIQKSLRDMGYAVEAGIYSAQEAGAPHQRERLFILAIMGHARQQLTGKPSNGFNGREDSDTQTIKTSKRDRPSNSIKILGNSEIRKNNIGRNGKLDEAEKERKSFNPSANDAGKELAIPKSGRYIHGSSETHTGKRGKYAQRNAGAGDKYVSYAMRAELQAPLRTRREGGELTNFPSPPGKAQNEWEEPRTAKPGMGCTVNGYNFREDLLRMYGNGVVEQQCEIAMIDLLKKHGIHNS